MMPSDKVQGCIFKAFLGIIQVLALFSALFIHDDLSYLLYIHNLQWKQSHSSLDV